MPLLRSPRFWRLLLWCALLGTLTLSLVPHAERLPSTGWDKSNHLLAFAVLAWLARHAHPATPAWRLGGALLAFGALIEGLQALTPSRYAEWGDLAADGLGIVVGFLLAWCVRRARRRPG